MERKFPHWISGLALYLLFSVLAGIATAMRMLGLGTFANFLGNSYDPRMALVFFSLLLGGVMMIFVRLGVEFPFLKLNLNDDAKRYVAGLPMWMIFLITAASALGVWSYSPPCRAPETVYFKIVGTQEQFQPMGILTVQPNQSLSIAAETSDPNAQLSCIKWEFTGPAFQPTGEKSGCQINLQFSDEPGSSFLSVVSTQNFCEQKSIFSLEVQVQPK